MEYKNIESDMAEEYQNALIAFKNIMKDTAELIEYWESKYESNVLRTSHAYDSLISTRLTFIRGYLASLGYKI